MTLNDRRYWTSNLREQWTSLTRKRSETLKPKPSPLRLNQNELAPAKFIKPLIRRFGGNYIKYLSLVVSKKMMKNYYADLLGVNASKIFLVNHHMCHAESAIFSLDKSKDWLVFTVDAEGDQEKSSQGISTSSGAQVRQGAEDVDVIDNR